MFAIQYKNSVHCFKNILTLVTMVRKTLFRMAVMGVRTVMTGGGSGSTPRAIRASRDLQPRNRLGGPVDGELLRHPGLGDSCWRSLAGFLLKASQGQRSLDILRRLVPRPPVDNKI